MKTLPTRLLAGLALTILPFLVLPAGAQSPTLGITNDSTLGLSVFWPVANAGFSLQWTPSLGTPIAWQPFPAAPSLSEDGNNLLVALSEFQAGNPLAFFELVSNIVVVPAAPSLVTTAAVPVNTTTAALNGTVQPNTFDTTYWFQWGTDITYGQTTLSHMVSGSNTAPVSVQVGITGLAAGTIYHFQLYGSNSDGISSGGDLTFTTAALLPDAIVQTFAASNITTSSAELLGSMNPNGSDIAGWFEWGTDTSYGNRTLDFPFAFPGFEVVDESDVITNLAPSTTYHYRIVAFNGGPTEALGNDVMFTTSTPFQQPPPSVTTSSATPVSPTSETISGTINPNGAPTTGLFIYNVAGGGTYTLSFSAGSGNSAQSFQTNLTGLAQNTTYFYTLVAYNSGGSSQGATLSFTTGSSQLPPTVTVGPATSVTSSTANLNGTVNPNGSATTYSFLYGTTPASITTPLGTFSAGNDNSVHSFSPPLTGLTPNTTYYYVLSANNSGGTSTTAPAAFTTSVAQQLPFAKTLAPGSVTENSAVLTGLVNPNGGPGDTQIHFVWGTTGPPYVNIAGGADAGHGTTTLTEVFTLTGLMPCTTYYYQIIATNNAGIANGDTAFFTTSGVGPGVGAALIPAGSFTMGNTIGDSDITDANPISIYVSAFYMDTNLVTWGQWQSVAFNSFTEARGYTFSNMQEGKGTNHPVQGVNWYDAVKWCNARSEQECLTPVYYTGTTFNNANVYRSNEVALTVANVNWNANGYRLPTEAEWEKAARGGVNGRRFPLGNTISESQANYIGDTGGSVVLGVPGFSYDLGPNGFNSLFNIGPEPWTSPVGYFAPNGYGLYDMAGNATEWCWDLYANTYGQPTTTNPTGPASSPPFGYRLIRGGYWSEEANWARCAFRFQVDPAFNGLGTGFRCMRAH